jgi:hypothetical protein
MFCTRCGTPNPDDASFCRNCSATLSKPGTPQRQTGSSGSPTDPYQPPTVTQPRPEQAPYPGYQGFPIQQGDYIRPPAVPQGGASGRAIAAMVMSLISLFTCGPFLSIPGAILGKMELDAIRSGQAPAAGETFAKIGFYGGLVFTAFFCLGGVLWGLLSFVGIGLGIN